MNLQLQHVSKYFVFSSMRLKARHICKQILCQIFFCDLFTHVWFGFRGQRSKSNPRAFLNVSKHRYRYIISINHHLKVSSLAHWTTFEMFAMFLKIRLLSPFDEVIGMYTIQLSSINLALAVGAITFDIYMKGAA